MSAFDRVTVRQAAMELNTTSINIQESLKRGELPIGRAIKYPGSSRYTYYIYRGLLDGYKNKIENGIIEDEEIRSRGLTNEEMEMLRYLLGKI